MKIHFHGAAGDVTGSAYHVVTNRASVLVDCGFFQGKKAESEKNRRQAKLETGKTVNVPLFIKEGELIKIDTRTGDYMGRA